MGTQAGQTPPAGGNTGGEDDDAAADAAFNARFEKAIAGEAFGKVLNKAFGAHSKRLLGSQEFKTSLTDVVKSAFAESRAANENTDDGGDDDGDDGQQQQTQQRRAPTGKFAKGMDPEVKRQLDAANRSAEQARKLAEEEKKKREESEARAAANEERQLLTEALAQHGVQKEMIGVALAYLKDEKRVARAQDGKIVWRDGDNELEVGEGVSAWAKTPLGQRFLPARDASGSGATPPTPGKRNASGKVEYSDSDLGNMLRSL